MSNKKTKEADLGDFNIVAPHEAYEIGDQLVDGSIYVGLSAASGRPLVTTAEDVGEYNYHDAVKVVAELNIHGGGGWRLPSGHWNKGHDELDVNLCKNRNKGALSGTFNLSRDIPAAGYWAAEHYGANASYQLFSGWGKYAKHKEGRSFVRPVRELAARD